jgi:hypothetical protein
VIGIHETFQDNSGAGEYHKVPIPDRIDATFWVHQFKLLEGIDDFRFQMLALFGELRSVRSFVQQVGRIIRNPGRARGATAHVLDHSKRARQTVLWDEFLEYDKLLEQGDSIALDVNQRSLVESLQHAVPGLLYIDGRFRVPADISKLGLDDVQLPLSANVFHKPSSISPDRIKGLIVRQCQDQDLFFHAPDSTADTVIVFHIRVGLSPILEKAFFPEPKLGISLVQVRGKYAFVYDSGPALGANAVGARPIDASRLRNLFGRNSGGKLTQVSMHNSNLGADQVRTRAMTAVSVDELAPTFDEHGYVLTTATGYGRGRRGDANSPETKVRRYIGIGNSRISDFGGGLVPFDVWSNWTSEVQHMLDGKAPPLRVFSRWAGPAGWPPKPAPRNVLIDLFEVLDRYRTTGEDDLPQGEDLEVSELCADVQNGSFSIEANGRVSEIDILAEPDEGKYILKSPELDSRYYSIDPEYRESVIHYLNRTQSFRVIPVTPGYFYTVGQFCRPLIQFGPEYDDSKMGVLGTLHPIPSLRNINSEKGDRSRRNGAGWERGSLFDLIDNMGAGTGLAQEFGGTDVLVCDDLRDESADFILVQDETAHHRRRVVFIHAKAKREASNCSASALQDVCGQAQKNLREVSLFAEAGPSKRIKWSEPWDGQPHTEGIVAERIRRRNRDSDPEDDIRRTVKDPNADREVWLMLGNLLSKETLETLLLKNSPPAYAIQAAYLLFSTITNSAAAGARMRVFCAP